MEKILKLKNITKKYPGVTALDDVSISFDKGEVHGLVGENGAGKSTFIKVITGVITPNEGKLFFKDREIENNYPIKSLNMGITAIYQEFNLIPHLSIAENIFHGQEIKNNIFIDYKAMRKKTNELLEKLGVNLAPESLIKNISVASQQIVEIAKALSREVEVLIMDEPSAALTNREIEYLYEIIERLKENGVTVIYISHRLEEVFEVADRVTVLRDGQKMDTLTIEETNEKELIKLMVGRELKEEFPEKDMDCIGEKVFEVKNLTNEAIKDISFKLRSGEILGIGGLVGAGRTEVARAIFGADPIQKGEIYLNGNKVNISSPREAIDKGIGLIPESRKEQGLLLNLDVQDNICYTILPRLSNNGIINYSRVRSTAKELKNNLDIKTPSMKQLVKYLSGGNQQKVVLAKWLVANTQVLIFDEPTRGIDVGAKREIYELINEIANEGKGVIIISSEMPELLGMSDRIIVMHEGRKMGELSKEKANQEKMLRMASGKKLKK